MQALDRTEPVYPESDGQPMAENTLQLEWILKLVGNLDAALPDFVGGDLFWYPVKGDPDIRVAPDVLVAIGRPKGHRGSYRTWDEGGVVPQVVMEVLSPSNTVAEMFARLGFYDRHGVEEFYVLDPDVNVLEVFVRQGGALREVVFDESFVSARLNVRFERKNGVLTVYHPDGRPFETVAEGLAKQEALAAERDALAAERDALAAERDALGAKAKALAERLRAAGLDPDE